MLDVVRRTWRDTLNQPDPGDLAEALKRLEALRPAYERLRADRIRAESDVERLTGRRVEALSRRAKYLIADLDAALNG